MKMTYQDRIDSARQTRIYEPLRESLQELLEEGYTRWEIALMLRIGRTKVELAIATLGLQTSVLGGGVRARRLNDYDAATKQLAADEGAVERALVTLCRRTYGPIGKGFSTA